MGNSFAVPTSHEGLLNPRASIVAAAPSAAISWPALDDLLAQAQAYLTAVDVLRFDDLELDKRTRQVRRAGRLIELTPTEFSLLGLFLENPQVVLARSLIFERVWGFDFGPLSNLLNVYVGYLRRKIGEPRLIHTVRGIGYVLREPYGA